MILILQNSLSHLLVLSQHLGNRPSGVLDTVTFIDSVAGGVPKDFGIGYRFPDDTANTINITDDHFLWRRKDANDVWTTIWELTPQKYTYKTTDVFTLNSGWTITTSVTDNIKKKSNMAYLNMQVKASNTLTAFNSYTIGTVKQSKNVTWYGSIPSNDGKAIHCFADGNWKVTPLTNLTADWSFWIRGVLAADL